MEYFNAFALLYEVAYFKNVVTLSPVITLFGMK